MFGQFCIDKTHFMKKFFKITGIILSVLFLVGTAFHFCATYAVDQRLQKKYTVTTEVFPIPRDSAAIAAGKHLVDIKGCMDCHAENMGGKIFADEFLLGTMAGPNLTRGKGGIPADYSTVDWVKAIHNGLNRENRPLMVMPSEENSRMSRQDLQNMIAYLMQLPPVDNEIPKSKMGVMINALTFLNQIDLIPAEKIDHQKPMIVEADRSTPAAFGKYLSAMCSGCHRQDMKGGPPMAPGFPAPPDLTSTGAVGKWTQEQFSSTLKTGVRPDGTTLDSSMPWQMTKYYKEEELQALYEYFKSL